MNRVIRAFAGLVFLATTFSAAFNAPTVYGFTPTPEQIQQFKNLSPDQQKNLAKQAGIDVSSLAPGGSGSSQPNLTEATPASQTGAQVVALEQEQEQETKGTETKAKHSLHLFGSDLFRDDWAAFRPPVSIPVPAQYIVGPGDNIIVQLYGKENTTHSFIINREGQVQFPQIGPVTLAGLTFNKAQDLISNIISEQKIGVKASVTMGALRTIRIFVLGDVKRPGSFTVGALSTLTNALFESGGITPVGSLRNIQLKRNGEIESTFDLYDLLLKGDTSNDARLQPGDVIFVPPIGKTVGIDGDIKRPALYEIKGEATAKSLIDLAGGLKNTAHSPASQLVRLNNNGEKNIINLDLSKRQQLATPLKDGDHLSIASTLDFMNNQIAIEGHLKRPGYRSWKKGLRFTDLINNPNQLLPNPDIETALVQRYNPETLEVSAFIFSPKRAWQAPGSNEDPLLMRRDVIQLFNYVDTRSERLQTLVKQLTTQADYNERKQTVSVSGSVRFPGVYPLTPNMTTEQLILLAGGLSESAMGTNGEITRYSIDQSRQRAVEHIPVNFTDTAVALAPGDTLQVKQIPLWKNKETVEINGEVMYPGTYTILPGESLGSLLERAGGLTPQAYAEGAIFSRKDLRNLEAQRIAEFKGKLQNDIATQTVNSTENEDAIDMAEAQMLLKNLDTLRPLGRMVIDLPRVITEPGNSDFELEDGDSLTIPRYKPSVTVVGEVQYPTSHFFEKSYDAITYVDRSGGFKKHADKSRVYIVKANGLVIQPSQSRWFRANASPIMPGDTIVVPLETDRLDKLSIWSKVTQIMYQAALGAAAVTAL